MGIDSVAVIGGTGHEGFGLAARWAKAGIETIVGSRDKRRAEDAARRLEERVPEGRVQALENRDAAAAARVVVVAVPFSGQAVIYKSIADHIGSDTVVVDCTVPLAASIGGRPTRVLGVWEGSAAQQASALLPKGATICSAFQNLPAAALHDLNAEIDADVLVTGSKAGKPAVKDLVEAIPNLRYVDGGPLENARIVESITALLVGINHRYGTDRSGFRLTGLPEPRPRD
jgi:NADPH-dependent F420 reductase